jgi:hypothetical protein|tara:strand:- start:285 stop:497 length:213 start_codon:yes stop_codon:yes gene_type:complete
MRASQFIDFINREKMPLEEEQLIRYTHIYLEDDRDENYEIVKVNSLKKARRKYGLRSVVKVKRSKIKCQQ